jgi:hypothetical protein
MGAGVTNLCSSLRIFKQLIVGEGGREEGREGGREGGREADLLLWYGNW